MRTEQEIRALLATVEASLVDARACLAAARDAKIRCEIRRDIVDILHEAGCLRWVLGEEVTP